MGIVTGTERRFQRERQKVGGPVLATIGRTPRSTTRRINRLKGTVADLLQPAIFRPPTFWRSPESAGSTIWIAFNKRNFYGGRLYEPQPVLSHSGALVFPYLCSLTLCSSESSGERWVEPAESWPYRRRFSIFWLWAARRRLNPVRSFSQC